MTTDSTPGHDPDRARREARREQERAASRARQRAAYQQAQRASRGRALRAAQSGGPEVSGAGSRPSRSADAPAPWPPTTAPLMRAWLRAEDSRERPSAELTAVELVEQRLHEAELERALLKALADLPAAERVAVVAALGYAEGPAGAAMELGVEPVEAEELARQGLDALRRALSPFLMGND